MPPHNYRYVWHIVDTANDYRKQLNCNFILIYSIPLTARLIYVLQMLLNDIALIVPFVAMVNWKSDASISDYRNFQCIFSWQHQVQLHFLAMSTKVFVQSDVRLTS